MSLEEITQQEGAFDAPGTNDFSADQLFGAEPVEKNLPASINLNNVPSHNQGRSMHCTAYGLTHIEEILNTIEHSQDISLDPEEQWGNQKARHGGLESMEQEGDSLQNALQTLVEKGLTNHKNPGVSVPLFKANGYAFVKKTVEDYKRWLASGMPIFTGWGNHCFAIVGYDDQKQVLIAKNSYGPIWGKKSDGTFDVPYAQINKLFTGYIVFDKADFEMIFKDVSLKSAQADSIKWALEVGLFRGYGEDADPKKRFFRPEQPITRAETAVVMKRLYDLLKK